MGLVAAGIHQTLIQQYCPQPIKVQYKFSLKLKFIVRAVFNSNSILKRRVLQNDAGDAAASNKVSFEMYLYTINLNVS